MRRLQQNKPKYPLSCVLRLSLRTHVDFESPGLTFAHLLGHSGASQPLPFERQFRLRATRRGLPVRDPALGPLSYGSVLDRDWIDMSTIRKCLEACEKHHGKGCGEHGFQDAMRTPELTRVLDVGDLCIKTPADPARCRYVALSYVQGNTKPPKLVNYSSLATPRSLERFMAAMPSTIIHAVEVVNALGERYLWVDALCIPQDDHQAAQEQIANMDRIYGSALLTIVAAEGADSSFGIRGVRRGYLSKYGQGQMRWIHQLSAEMRDGLQIDAPLQTINRSSWALGTPAHGRFKNGSCQGGFSSLVRVRLFGTVVRWLHEKICWSKIQDTVSHFRVG